MKKLLPFIFFLTIFTGNYCIAWITFQKEYSGGYSTHPGGLTSTQDGGFIITGNVHDSGGPDHIFILKSDTYGNIEWSRTYDGYSAWASAIVQTADNGYIFTGYTYDMWLGQDVPFLIKLDSMGNLHWSRIYPMDNLYLFGSRGTAVRQTLDGGFILTGDIDTINYNARTFLLKTDASGLPVWNKKFRCDTQNSLTLSATDIVQSGDSGFTIIGKYDGGISLLKTDTIGSILWKKFYSSGTSIFQQVYQLNDGGYILSGANSNHSALVRTDNAGDTLWSKSYNAYFTSFCPTSDGGYFLSTFDGGWEVCLTKTDSSGNILWTHNNNLPGGNMHINAVARLQDGYLGVGNIWAGGGFNDYLYAIKLDPIGRNCFETTSSLNSGQNSFPVLSYPVFEQSPFISDSIFSLSERYTGTSANWCSSNTIDAIPAMRLPFLIEFLPNPFSSALSLRFFNPQNDWGQLCIFSSLGEIVMEKEIILTNQTLDLPDMANGIYLVIVRTNRESFSGKLIKNNSSN